jgi:osmoprotectant transport system ATP-binding protein
VIFVTHDIDEAIKMGDRIAILHQGGVLAQYATPDELLARPASEFVERFVGADRGLKRLSLRRVSDVELEPPGIAASDAPRCNESTTLRDALSVMLTEGAQEVVVVGGDGEPVGALPLQRVSELLREQVTA